MLLLPSKVPGARPPDPPHAMLGEKISFFRVMKNKNACKKLAKFFALVSSLFFVCACLTLHKGGRGVYLRQFNEKALKKKRNTQLVNTDVNGRAVEDVVEKKLGDAIIARRV